VRRTRSIVGMPWPTMGVGAIVWGGLASCLRRAAVLVRGVSIVAIGGLDRHQRRVGRRDAWEPKLRCLATDAMPWWLRKSFKRRCEEVSLLGNGGNSFLTTSKATQTTNPCSLLSFSAGLDSPRVGRLKRGLEGLWWMVGGLG
jgi:hypothetical protein